MPRRLRSAARTWWGVLRESIADTADVVKWNVRLRGLPVPAEVVEAFVCAHVLASVVQQSMLNPELAKRFPLGTQDQVRRLLAQLMREVPDTTSPNVVSFRKRHTVIPNR